MKMQLKMKCSQLVWCDNGPLTKDKGQNLFIELKVHPD